MTIKQSMLGPEPTPKQEGGSAATHYMGCLCTCDHKGEGECVVCTRKRQELASPLSQSLDPGQSCEHVAGGMCPQCIAKIRAEGFQEGYKLGYETGVDYCRQQLAPKEIKL